MIHWCNDEDVGNGRRTINPDHPWTPDYHRMGARVFGLMRILRVMQRVMLYYMFCKQSCLKYYAFARSHNVQFNPVS